MSRCQGSTSACSGRDLAPVRIGLRRDVLVFCGACRAIAEGMGLRIVERRAVSVPVAQERRAFVAPWLARLTARDLTGAVLR